MGARSARTVMAAAAVAVLAPAARAQPIATAPEGWSAIERCARLIDPEARRDCSDQVMRRAGLVPPPPEAPPPARLPAPASRPVARQAEAPPPPPPEHRRGLPFIGGGGDVMEAVISKAHVDGEGKLVLATRDGSVWRAVERDPALRLPKAGETVTISPSLVTRFECKIGRWTDFLCERRK